MSNAVVCGLSDLRHDGLLITFFHFSFVCLFFEKYSGAAGLFTDVREGFFNK
jgi:hypothetical protein